jgi:hypothetical protein
MTLEGMDRSYQRAFEFARKATDSYTRWSVLDGKPTAYADTVRVITSGYRIYSGGIFEPSEISNEDLEGLGFLRGVENLFIQEQDLPSFEFMRHLPEIKALALINCRFDLKALPRNELIERITLKVNEEIDLLDVAKFPKLRNLTIEAPAVTNVEIINDFPELQFLSLTLNEAPAFKNIVDRKHPFYIHADLPAFNFEWIQHLKGLERIFIKATRASGYEALAGLRRLSQFTLSTNSEIDARFLALNSILTTLELRTDQEILMPEGITLPNLYALTVACTGELDLSFLNRSKKIKFLHLGLDSPPERGLMILKGLSSKSNFSDLHSIKIANASIDGNPQMKASNLCEARLIRVANLDPGSLFPKSLRCKHVCIEHCQYVEKPLPWPVKVDHEVKLSEDDFRLEYWVLQSSYRSDYEVMVADVRLLTPENFARLSGTPYLTLNIEESVRSLDLGFLEGLVSLKGVTLLSKTLEEVTGVSKMRHWTSLYLSSSAWKDVSIICDYPWIRYWGFKGSMVADLSPLLKLKQKDAPKRLSLVKSLVTAEQIAEVRQKFKKIKIVFDHSYEERALNRELPRSFYPQ